MAAWSNVATRQIGKRAEDVFSKPIEFVDAEIAECNVSGESDGDDGATVQRISLLINLAKKDGISPEERSRLEQMISNAGLDAAVTDQLRSQLQSPGYEKADYDQLRRSPDDALSVFVGMVALSMADGRMTVTEKVTMRQVGRLLGFSDRDIEEMIASEGAG